MEEPKSSMMDRFQNFASSPHGGTALTALGLYIMDQAQSRTYQQGPRQMAPGFMGALNIYNQGQAADLKGRVAQAELDKLGAEKAERERITAARSRLFGPNSTLQGGLGVSATGEERFNRGKALAEAGYPSLAAPYFAPPKLHNIPADAKAIDPRDPSTVVAKGGDKTTSAMANALALKLVPGTPEYNDYIRKATVERVPMQINMGQTKEVEKYKTEMKIHSKRLESMQKRADAFTELTPRLETIALGLESGNVETGPVKQALFPLRQVLNELGYGIDENLPQAEQVRAAMSFLVPRMRVVGSGSTSDKEMAEFKRAGPQFANTPQGNILLARSFMQIDHRNKRAYNIALKYFSNKGTLVGVDEHIDRQLGPIFPKPLTAAEHARIRPGVVYYHVQKKRFLVKR